jgi:rRNA-processing protein FCF1
MFVKPVVFLDVHMEDLEAILSQKNWDVRKATKELPSTEDEEIIRYAEKTKCVVVTDNDEIVRKLLAAGLFVVSIDTVDRARIIHEKLERVEILSHEPVTTKNSLEFCKQHFYLL